MDIKEYIKSGIIERYVFGTASGQERQEVECMSHIYPEIKVELTALQDSIELLATKAAVNPPEELKVKLMQAIKKTPQEESIAPLTKVVDDVIPLKVNKFYRNLAAASILLLVGLGFYSAFLFSDMNKVNAKLSEKSTEINTIQNSLVDIESKQLAAAQELDFLRDLQTVKVVMNGTEAHPDKLASVYWNKSNKRVLLDATKLPASDLDKDYQLWVIADGTPQDMGVFNIEDETSIALLEMKAVEGGQAFAITIEPKGGSVAPSLDQLMVIGNV